MKNTLSYEPTNDVLHSGEHFKATLVFDVYAKEAVCKECINPTDEFARGLLESQAEFLKDSNHPSIVNFRDKMDAKLYMEAMAGDLHSFAEEKGKRFSDGETVSFLRQMLNLLSYLDLRELTVGQLSPRTILCNEDFSVFKIGMAYAKSAPIPADSQEIIFPPEINATDEYNVHVSDIYCLGMTCIELILGTSEFRSMFAGMYDESSDLWIQWHANPHVTFPELTEKLSGFPTGLVSILQQMIAKPIHMRFNSADEILRELNGLGISDGEVVVKQKRSLSTTAVASGMVAILVAVIGWGMLKPTPAPAEKPLVVVEQSQPTLLELAISSNIPFSYQIGKRDISEAETEATITINESEELWIQCPQNKAGWVLWTGDVQHRFHRKRRLKIDWKKFGDSTEFKFERLLKIKSDYSDFVWNFGPDLEQASSSKVISVVDLNTSHIWIMPNEPSVELAKADNSKRWSKVQLPSGNELKLDFVREVQFEALGYKELSQKLFELNVKVGREKLEFDGNRFFKARVPYTDKGQTHWNTTVSHAGQTLFEEMWTDIPSKSDSRKSAMLYSKANIEIPDGFELLEVNGETGFDRSERMVKVPFGEQLDIAVSDFSGVIQLRDSIDWTTNFRFDVAKFMSPKELRSENGRHAKFFLSRENHTGKKEFSAYEIVQLPMQNMDAYRISVQWDSGHKREFPLRKFMSFRKPVEKRGAITSAIPQNIPSSNIFAVNQTQASK